LLHDEEADATLAHAAACAACAALLRDSIELFRPAADVVPVRPSRLRWVAAAAAVVAIALIAWGYFARTQPPVTLLAQAYSESRPFAAMWPGAAHAPLQRTHGPAGSRPASLLRAELKIQEHLAGRTPDAAWLQAQAATELFELNPTAALRTRERAADLGASSTALDLQWAITYLTRGDEQSRDPDYRQAAELFSRVLAAEPGNATALFNRALVMERLRLPDQGIADLRAYLALRPSAPWRTEAEERLQRLEQMRGGWRFAAGAGCARTGRHIAFQIGPRGVQGRRPRVRHLGA
jgi:tetratricopeptide (TPR) repeat protein